MKMQLSKYKWFILISHIIIFIFSIYISVFNILGMSADTVYFRYIYIMSFKIYEYKIYTPLICFAYTFVLSFMNIISMIFDIKQSKKFIFWIIMILINTAAIYLYFTQYIIWIT